MLPIEACRSSFILTITNLPTTIEDFIDLLLTTDFTITQLHAIFIVNRDPIFAQYTIYGEETIQSADYPFTLTLIFNRYDYTFNINKFIELLRRTYASQYIMTRTMTTLQGQPRYNDIYGTPQLDELDRKQYDTIPNNPWTLVTPAPPISTQSQSRKTDSKSDTRQSIRTAHTSQQQ
jgi:hypothetical protein